MRTNTFIFTCGDTNGIGPEIALRSINELYSKSKCKFILPIPPNVFQKYADLIDIKFPYKFIKRLGEIDQSYNGVTLVDIGDVKIDVGKPTRFSGRASYRSIIEAHKIIKLNLSSGMITAPISKIAWQKAGINYPGHTELLGELSNSKNYAMMFLSKSFKGMLATIHDPINKVPRLINKTKIRQLITLLHHTLIKDLNILDPKIAVLGLNPHAGECGKIGNEEIKILQPSIIDSVERGFNVYGPCVPDAFFANKLYLKYDAILSMYHDQLLIPFKMLHFNKGVNYTAGLSFVRTSPDHGTAYDIAGKLKADITSTIESFKWSRRIVKNRD